MKPRICLITTMTLLLVICPTEGLANPQSGQVAAGSATITQPASNTVQITQTTNKAVINWQTFNIAPNETTKFVQPSSGSITLNRINPLNGGSNIQGGLTANGQIWLINPAGVLFGSTARVDVAGLLVTTADISDANFMAGNYKFTQSPNWHGSIINNGMIHIANGGYAALIAPGVQNNGVIKANFGTVVLAAGNTYTVNFDDDPLISFGVNANITQPGVDNNGKALTSAVANTGKIIANGGTVLMTARAAQGVVENVINESGIVEAKSVSQHNGVITLSGGDQGVVSVSGKLIATGHKHGQTGGTVQVTGQEVGLFSGADIDVSGAAGGGTVLIGGDEHGTNPNVQDAQYTYVDPNAVINANAITTGNGGKVIVWSDLGTQFYGNITSRGGSQSGNGGFVETSGKDLLQVIGGSVNASASAVNGNPGTWLMDPFNVTIAGTTTNGSFNAGNPDVFTPSGNNATVDASTIITALNGGTSVTINTTGAGSQAGDITITSAINTSVTGSPTLTLNAVGSIHDTNTAQFTNLSGQLNVIFNAGGAVTISAPMTVYSFTVNAPSATINLTGFGFKEINSSGGGQNYNLSGGTLTLGSDVTLSDSDTITGGNINVNGNVNGAGHVLTLGSFKGGYTITGTLSGVGTVLDKQGTGTLTLSSPTASTYSGGTTIEAGNVVMGNGASLGTGAVDVAAAATLTLPSSAFTVANNITLDGGASLPTAANLVEPGNVNGILNGNLTVNDMATVDVTTSSNLTLNGNLISGTGTPTLTTIGQSTFHIASDNSSTWSGTIDVSNYGTLEADASGAFGNSSSVVNIGPPASLEAGVLLNVNNGTFASALIINDNGELENGGNNTWSGPITLSATTTNPIIALNSGLLTVTGNVNGANDLSITGAGGITFAGAVGNSTPPTSVTANIGGDITFSNSTQINGDISLTSTGGNININGPMVIEGSFLGSETFAAANNININNSLSYFGVNSIQFAAGGSISETGTGTISVPNFSVTTTFAVLNPGSNILLNGPGNDFPGSVIFNGNVNNLTFENGDANPGAITLPTNVTNLTLTYDNAGIILPTGTIGGNLVVTALNDITESGPLNVAGTSNFISTTGNIDVSDSGANDNIFTGAVSLNSALDSTIGAQGSIILNTSIVGGNLTVNSGGSITQVGAITTTDSAATSTFNLNGSSSDLTLNNPGNFFAGAKAFAGNIQNFNFLDTNTAFTNFSLAPAGAINNLTVDISSPIIFSGVPAGQLTGNLSLTASTIQIGGDIIAGGSLSLTASGGIILTPTQTNFTATGMTFNGTIDGMASGAQSLKLTAGTGDIIFNNNVGATIPLGTLEIARAHDVTNNAEIHVTSFLQDAGTGSKPTTDVGSNTLFVSGLASFITYDVTGHMEVGSLDLDVAIAEIVDSTVGSNPVGLASAQAVNVVNLSTVGVGNLFFDGYDLTFPQQVVTPTAQTTVTPNTPATQPIFGVLPPLFDPSLTYGNPASNADNSDDSDNNDEGYNNIYTAHDPTTTSIYAIETTAKNLLYQDTERMNHRYGVCSR